ncbi:MULTISPECIES: glycosyltransferase family 2 protein [Sphingobacterium]|uniref:glycosyltransferase family 2 protein n=1 Tax=Sphingobacterium TaxID=28453 RepID=UPI0013DBCF87|nr:MULTISPECIES: glycosyltransferase [unclassified Sphingobacterium]
MGNLVSVIIPTFNNVDTIIDTLQSVFGQTYECIEVIIVNDGSTDGTLEKVEYFIKDKDNFYLFSTDNRGVSAARNYGFENSKGELVVFLDADDLLDANYIKLCVDQFDTDPSIHLVYTKAVFFERIEGVFKLPDFSMQRLLFQNCFTVTSMLKSNDFREVGMFDVNLSYAEDWEFWIRLVSKYPKVVKIEKPLFFYRRRNSLNSATDLRDIKNVAESSMFYIYKKHHELYLKHGLGIDSLLKSKADAIKYKQKYYNIWYKKVFYFFKREK